MENVHCRSLVVDASKQEWFHEVDAATFDAPELVGVNGEALDRPGEDGTAADAADRLKHFPLSVYPMNYYRYMIIGTSK